MTNSTIVITADNSKDTRRTLLDPNIQVETLNVIGTSERGPAFVPTIVGSYNATLADDTLNTFQNIFGSNVIEYSNGSIAANTWFRGGGQQLSFTRVLGIGNGEAANETTGIVPESGFIVGEQPIKFGITPDKKSDSKRAVEASQGNVLGKGRTFFYCKMYDISTGNLQYTDSINPDFNLIKQFEITSDLESNNKIYFIDKIIMSAHGNYLTLNPYESNDVRTLNGATSETIIGNSNNNWHSQINNESLNDNLKTKEVHSTLSYGAGNLIGSYASIYKLDLAIDDNSNRFFINGLKNDVYNTTKNTISTINFAWHTFDYGGIFNPAVSNENTASMNSEFKFLYEKGHVEYADFKASFSYSVLSNLKRVQLLLPSKLSHNTFDVDNSIPNYEDFQSTYQTAKTPWIVSQRYTGVEKDDRTTLHKEVKKLFRFHSLDDGESGNRFRIRIKPLQLGKILNDPREKQDLWSKFNISVSEYNKNNNSFDPVMELQNVDLNPDSKSYICRLIGTKHTYWDKESNKIVTEGLYPNTNQFLRIEVHQDVEDKLIKPFYMPCGFVSYPHININIDNIKNTSKIQDVQDSIWQDDDEKPYKLIQKPVDYILNLNRQVYDSLCVKEELYWGVLFTKARVNVTNIASRTNNRVLDLPISITKKNNTGNISIEENKINFIQYSIEDEENEFSYRGCFEYSKWFQNTRKDINVWAQDDNYCNGLFHLEKILYFKNAEKTQEKWLYSFYRRDGKEISKNDLEIDVDFLNEYSYVLIDDVLKSEDGEDSSNSEYLKFDFFTYGGFDGTNCFEYDKKILTNSAVIRELENEDSNDSTVGPTYKSYSKAIELSAEYSNTLCDILAVPGITHPVILKEIVEISKDKKSFISLLDTPVLKSNGEYITDYVFKEMFGQVDLQFNDPNSELNISLGDIGYEKVNLVQNPSEAVTVPSLIAEGTASSLSKYNSLGFDTKYVIGLHNGLISENVRPDLTSKLELSPSILAINALSRTTLNPVLNIDLNSNEVNNFDGLDYNFTETLNDNLINEGNNKASFLRLSQDYNLNVVTKENTGDSKLKLNSANTNLNNRKSMFRLSHNVRIMNEIKKSIRNALYGTRDNLANSKGELFNSMVSDNVIRSRVKFIIERILNLYKKNKTISDFRVNLDSKNNILQITESNNYTIKGNVLISLYGSFEEDNLLELDLTKLLQTASTLTDTFNTEIVINKI